MQEFFIVLNVALRLAILVTLVWIGQNINDLRDEAVCSEMARNLEYWGCSPRDEQYK
jgi:hypothetical protein